jgi:hypothetical protein
VISSHRAEGSSERLVSSGHQSSRYEGSDPRQWFSTNVVKREDIVDCVNGYNHSTVWRIQVSINCPQARGPTNRFHKHPNDYTGSDLALDAATCTSSSDVEARKFRSRIWILWFFMTFSSLSGTMAAVFDAFGAAVHNSVLCTFSGLTWFGSWRA